jgi:hypothetical protein
MSARAIEAKVTASHITGSQIAASALAPATNRHTYESHASARARMASVSVVAPRAEETDRGTSAIEPMSIADLQPLRRQAPPLTANPSARSAGTRLPYAYRVP